MPLSPRPPTSRLPSTDGVTLEVHDLGGSGRPLLLAHATGFHGLVWEPLFSHLTGFHGWAPDLRAHGASTRPTARDLDWDGFADDVLAVVDALRTQEGIDEPLCGLGHSKGGAALLLAEERRPGTFASLYVFEPVVFPPDFAGFGGEDPDENPLAAGARRRRSQFPSRDAAYANFAAKPPLSQLDPAALRAYVDHGFVDTTGPDGEPLVELRCRPEDEAQVYEMGGRHQAFSKLDQVRCPVTVARGALGGFGPAAFVDAIAAALPHGRVETFDGLGHFGPLEDPALVAASVQQALTP